MRDANKARIAASKNRTVTAVLYNIGETAESRISPAIPVSSAIPQNRPIVRISATAKALCAGLVVTILQIVIAIFLLAPEGPFQYRYRTLVQHDSHWFANIVDRGYRTIVPPISHKMMEVSNTGFFPAYPALAWIVHRAFDLDAEDALLITAQSAAFGFWTYFFLFGARWNLPFSWQFLGALAILAHPAAFFLVAAYSESLFLMALIGFLYWSAAETRRARVLAAVHGIVMSATRIVGLPCALAPLIKKIWELGAAGLRNVRDWLPNYGRAVLLSATAMLGGLGFFLYCQLRWGRWDIYMLTQQFGWDIRPDYLAIFKPSSYHWLLPNLAYPAEMSQMAMTLGGLMLLAMFTGEFFFPKQRPTNHSVRIVFYFAAFVLYFLSVSGVACVNMESMLRYEFSLHPLIVLALLHYLHNLPFRSWLGRATAMAAIALIGAAGLGLESWYIWNFTRGNWVA
jgi:hypothetical protein